MDEEYGISPEEVEEYDKTRVKLLPKNYDIREELLESFPLMEIEEIKQDMQWIKENKLNLPLFKYDILPYTLNAIIAPMHTGKTYFLINHAYHLANQGKVLYITTEQTVREIRRVFYDVYIKNKSEKIMDFAKVNPKNIKIEYMKSGTISALEIQLEKIAKNKDYDFVVIDYITADLVHDAKGEYTAASQLAALINEIFIVKYPTTVFTAMQANTNGQQAGIYAIRNAALSIGQYMREGSKALDLFNSISFLSSIGLDDSKNSGRYKQRYITTCKARYNSSDVIGEQYYIKFNNHTGIIDIDPMEINSRGGKSGIDLNTL